MADGLQLTENKKRLLKMSASELLALWLTIYARALAVTVLCAMLPRWHFFESL